MAGKRHVPTFEEYVKANQITKCAGFWYCGPGGTWDWDARDYRGVLLACAEDGKNPKTWPRSIAKEVVAPSVRSLAAEIRRLGYEPPRSLGRLCESARLSPKQPRQKKAQRLTQAVLTCLLLLLTAHCSLPTAFAQGTPGTVRFPTSLDTVDSLFQVADAPSTKLAVAITSGSTTITVPANGTANFPPTGSLKIDDEVVYYGAKTSSTFTTLTRGASGTTAAAHALNSSVRSPILAAHHNTLALSLIGTQTKLGFGSSVPALNKVFFGTGAGTSGWVAQPAIDCTNCTNLPAGAVASVFGRTGVVVPATNDYTWAQVNKSTSSLADITTRSASDLSSGTLPNARFPSTLPALNGSALTNLNASNLDSGTLPNARFPATLPAANGANLTGLNASNVTSGTLPDARLPNTGTPGTYENVTITVDAHGRITLASETYKVYVATLSQGGTSAPVPVVLKNTLGGTLVFSRSDVGQYAAVLAGAFPTASKIWISPNSITDAAGNTIVISRGSANQIDISTNSDNALNDTAIEIRVYP